MAVPGKGAGVSRFKPGHNKNNDASLSFGIVHRWEGRSCMSTGDADLQL
jgi:hypothetical protein